MTPTDTLRHDPSAWMIEDTDAAIATVEALEAMALIFGELLLRRISALPFDTDTQLALRGLGTLAGTLGNSRLTYLAGLDAAGNPLKDSAGNPDSATAAGHARAVLDWLLEQPIDTSKPPTLRPPSTPTPATQLALDELHAAAVYFHRRAHSAGTAGPGAIRATARRSTMRSR